MYGYNSDNYLTKDSILRYVYQKDIFQMVFEECEINRYYTSPFRTDSVPGAYFEWYRGKLYFIDFGDTVRSHRDCFNAIQDAYNVRFNEALEIIDNHFNLGLGSGRAVQAQPVQPEPRPSISNNVTSTDIIFRSRPFDLRDQHYWSSMGVSSENLIEDNVFAVLWYKFFSRRFNRPVSYRPRGVAYSYTEFDDNRIKIYAPFATDRERKWIANVTKDDIGSIDHLPIYGEKLIITKSYKDCRILRNFGLNAVWFQNEGVIPESQKLTSLCIRFDRVIVLFDSDYTGRQATEKLVRTICSIFPNRASSVFFPSGGKDTAEYYLNKGRAEMLRFLVQNDLI